MWFTYNTKCLKSPLSPSKCVCVCVSSDKIRYNRIVVVSFFILFYLCVPRDLPVKTVWIQPKTISKVPDSLTLYPTYIQWFPSLSTNYASSILFSNLRIMYLFGYLYPGYENISLFPTIRYQCSRLSIAVCLSPLLAVIFICRPNYLQRNRRGKKIKITTSGQSQSEKKTHATRVKSTDCEQQTSMTSDKNCSNVIIEQIMYASGFKQIIPMYSFVYCFVSVIWRIFVRLFSPFSFSHNVVRHRPITTATKKNGNQ